MSNITKAEQNAAEQLEADELEGIEPASPEAMELIKRFRHLKKLMAPHEEEIKTIQSLIKEEMTKKGLGHLTYNGVEVTTLSVTHRTGFDKKGAIENLGLDVIGAFITTSDSVTLRIK